MRALGRPGRRRLGKAPRVAVQAWSRLCPRGECRSPRCPAGPPSAQQVPAVSGRSPRCSAGPPGAPRPSPPDILVPVHVHGVELLLVLLALVFLHVLQHLVGHVFGQDGQHEVLLWGGSVAGPGALQPPRPTPHPAGRRPVTPQGCASTSRPAGRERAAGRGWLRGQVLSALPVLPAHELLGGQWPSSPRPACPGKRSGR